MLASLTLFTRRVNSVFLALSGLIAVALLLVMSYDLLARAVFGASGLWAIDVSRFMLVFVFFLALGPALENGSHVSVDLLEHYLAPGPKRVLRIVAIVLTLVFGAFVMWQIWRTTYQAFVEDALFPTVIPVKLKYVYWIAPLGVLQFLLTALAQLGEALKGGGAWKA